MLLYCLHWKHIVGSGGWTLTELGAHLVVLPRKRVVANSGRSDRVDLQVQGQPLFPCPPRDVIHRQLRQSASQRVP